MPNASVNTSQFKFFAISLFWFYITIALIFMNPSNNDMVNNSISSDSPYIKIVNDDNEVNKVTKLYAFDEKKFLTSDLVKVFNENNYNYESLLRYKKVPSLYISSLPEDFGKITSSSKKKSLFIRSILPLIIKENNKIETLSKKIKTLNKNFKRINRNQALWLNEMLASYRVNTNSIDDLLVKVDVIPVSIALGQAAIESGWGTSRFAMEGNALYGQWSWKAGSGIVPKERDKNENVLINRGWIKKELKGNPNINLKTETGREIIGLLREIYKPSMFKPDNDIKNNIWFSINLEDLKEATGEQFNEFVIFLEDNRAKSPLPKKISIDVPNNHLKYAITWYAISISIIFYYLYFRRKK